MDNSRETVDSKGVIQGIRATASTAKVLSGLAISAAALDPMSQLFAASAALSAFRIPESEIILPVGTELSFRIDQPIAITQQFPALPEFLKSGEQETQLAELIRPLPFRTETTNPATPSDLISLLYLGSEDSIKKAFDAAGWVPADPLSPHSKYGVMRSIMENQGYREGPVAALVLNSQTPTLVFPKRSTPSSLATTCASTRNPPRSMGCRFSPPLPHTIRERHQQESQITDPPH